MAAEAGPSQWNFLANESELFAWARSFLNDDVDAMNTMPGASFPLILLPSCPHDALCILVVLLLNFVYLSLLLI